MTNKWVIDNFLKSDHFELMKDTFPHVTSPGVRAHNDLYCGDPEYRKFITAQEGWRRFHNMIFSKAFWTPFMPSIDAYAFNPSYLEHRSGCMDPKEQRPFLYSRIDIGVARPGYGIENGGRGIHIDNKQRVISGLLYFIDQSELDGGEFCFCTPDGRITQKVDVAENRAIISHQDKDAYHFVNPLKSGTRYFVYFSLNATWSFYKR